VESKADFATYFALARENGDDAEFWAEAILQCKETIDAEGDRTTRSRKRHRAARKDISYLVDHTEFTDDSPLENSDYEGLTDKSPGSLIINKVAPHTRPIASKRLIASSPPPCMLGPPRSTMITPAPFNTPPASSQGELVKPEPTDSDGCIPAVDLIKIFVGKTNETFFECTRTSLAQSRVLSECITTRDGVSHVMDPSFADINLKDFSAVVQFLNFHEYEPLLLHSEDAFSLDDSSGPINYPKDLERSANLFNLAKRFQLPALADLVFHKVLHGHHKYDAQPFLSFASIILAYQQSDFQAQDDIKGILEDWVIKFLAENMKTFCTNGERDAKKFWQVIEIKGVEVKVLRLRAEFCERFPCGRIKIDD
jgi:hypothetical protein